MCQTDITDTSLSPPAAQANLVVQQSRLVIANMDLEKAQAELDAKQAELDVVQGEYDQAMMEKQVKRCMQNHNNKKQGWDAFLKAWGCCGCSLAGYRNDISANVCNLSLLMTQLLYCAIVLQ